MEKMKTTEFLSVSMPPALSKQIRIAAAHAGVSRAKLVRQIVIDFLKREADPGTAVPPKEATNECRR